MKTAYFQKENIKEVSGEILERIRPFCKSYRPVLDKDRMALLVVDMQHFFCDPHAHGFIPSAPAIIPGIMKLQKQCMESGIPVILTRHVNTEADAGMMGIRWKEVVTRENPQSAVIPELLLPGTTILEKSQFDAFFGTILEEKLKKEGRDQLIVCGVMTNLCCETTVRSAFVRGFEPLFPVDTTAAYNFEFHLSTFINLVYGFISPLNADEVIQVIINETY
ncbi:MAG: isochorismatase family protein [Bacteroidetes bacterium]|nr:isochorismatase family protein [Bacteroidota bacterium]